MHAFALRLKDQAQAEIGPKDIAAHLTEVLGYPIPKPLAKYLAEHNWYTISGQQRQ